jgi:hypothetical protein
MLHNDFLKFHETIRLTWDQTSALREKRDMLVEEIRSHISLTFAGSYKKVPTFKEFNQGSYYLGTGIKALPGQDHDIDIGLQFHFSPDDYKPVDVKQWIYDALSKNPNRRVEFKTPCIRVQYTKKGTDLYHVDIVAYCEKTVWNTIEKYMAKGKVTTKPEDKKWEPADPDSLKKKLEEKWKGDDWSQFVRVIRYLKRWKDNNFPPTGYARPKGIAITACAYEWFTPGILYNYAKQKNEYNDAKAVRDLVNRMISNFGWPRLRVKLPVKPGNDLFEKMTDQQHKEFKEKLERLRDRLDEAMRLDANGKGGEARKLLQKEFGNDFPA